MKKTHIILILVIAVCIGAFITTLADSSTYASFSEAFENPNREFHVVGVYNKEKPYVYLPEIDANSFEFYLIDQEKNEKKVILLKSKPQDFEKSEQIVVIGKAHSNGTFVASDILMKCPSKYNENTLQ